MSETRRLGRPECEEVLTELEELRAGEPMAGGVLSRLTMPARRHATECEECRAAIEDFVVTRVELRPLRATLPEAGPWFATKVMSAIRSAEIEIEEKKDGVWVSVRRMAPRLAAFAALLLVLGGTWAMEMRRREVTSGQAQMRQVEGLFEAVPSAPLNDDIVASASEGTRP